VTNKVASQEMHHYRALFTRHDLGVLSPPYPQLLAFFDSSSAISGMGQKSIPSRHWGLKKPAKAGLISSHFKLILNGKSA